MDNLESLQQREIDYWRDSEHESPESDSVFNLINKMSDISVFMEVQQRYQSEFSKPAPLQILELGGGQGWSSCLVKRLYPTAHVTLTDISDFAIQSAPKWERIFQVRLDASYACTSYEIKEADESVDLVYCFAAAHHFRAHRRTLVELNRILRPGGAVLYLYEPTCRRILHGLAYRRVNRIRPAVEEDVLVWRELLQVARKIGLDSQVEFHPSTLRRGPRTAIYYAILASIPPLCRMLPCTANFVFRKPDPSA